MHQAIEAKEGGRSSRNQTLATITLQNFFRLDKLSGMTGTADRGRQFSQIYKLGVVPIPTNKEMIRQDQADLVYKSEAASSTRSSTTSPSGTRRASRCWSGRSASEVEAALRAAQEARGPARGARAKQHEREAQIVAEAGRKGAVTVATNMAGRGTDIMLGGNVEFLADHVARRGLDPVDTPEDYEKSWPEAVEQVKTRVAAEHDRSPVSVGSTSWSTERHESRRIDNQLRGRSGRQGDPGESGSACPSATT